MMVNELGILILASAQKKEYARLYSVLLGAYSVRKPLKQARKGKFCSWNYASIFRIHIY